MKWLFILFLLFVLSIHTTHAYFFSRLIGKGEINIMPVKEKEAILNGSFEHGLDDWEAHGDAVLVQGNDSFATPKNGKFMVRLGRSDGEGQSARANSLSQYGVKGLQSLSFSYNIFSQNFSGWKDPALIVFVNDRIVWQHEVAEQSVINETSSSGWQQATINLSEFAQNMPITITFYAGNDSLNVADTIAHQTWVYIDDIH